MFKKIIVLLLSASLLLALSACSFDHKLTFYTGGDQGTYYTFGNLLAEQVSNSTDTHLQVETSGGSQDNIKALKDDKADVAMSQSDIMSYAYDGIKLFSDGGETTDFSVIAALYSEQVQIVTCDPEITSVSDLEGKAVSIGETGSGVYYNALDILDVYGLNENSIEPVYEGFGDSVDSLESGKIEAAFVVSGAPTEAVEALQEKDDVYLISLDEQHIADLIGVSPYYSECVIPADTYGLASDVETVDVDAVLLANDAVSDDAAYNIISGIFGDVPELESESETADELDLAYAGSVTTVPYHPGAAKYYEENGISVATR